MREQNKEVKSKLQSQTNLSQMVILFSFENYYQIKHKINNCGGDTEDTEVLITILLSSYSLIPN